MEFKRLQSKVLIIPFYVAFILNQSNIKSKLCCHPCAPAKDTVLKKEKCGVKFDFLYDRYL